MNYSKVFTPGTIAELLVRLCNPYMKEGTWLEPSAGQGAIAHTIKLLYMNSKVTSIEPELKYFIYLWNSAGPLNIPFEEFSSNNKFDFIVANPPFDNDKWWDHLVKMYDHLKEGGTLVSIVPLSPLEDNTLDFEEVQKFYESTGADLITIENWYKPEKYPIGILRIQK